MKESKILKLSEIFNGKRAFKIPDYQRAYSWDKEQRYDLMEDIDNLLDKVDYTHYTGTIVATKMIEENSFYIVDGQQRLTSLIILLRCIKEFINNDTKVEIENQYLFTGRETGNTLRFFTLNGNLDDYFLRKLEDPNYFSEEHITKAHTNINEAFIEFSDWLNEKETREITKIYEIVTNHLGFLFYVPETNKEAGLMFEVINNRGKELSELEKIKNYLIYFSEKTEIEDLYKTVNDYWGKIMFHLNACGHTSNQAENNFLRNTWVVFEDTNKSESYHVYKNLKANYPPVNESDWKKLISYVKFLEIAAQTYNKLFTRSFVNDPHEKLVLKQSPRQTGTLPSRGPGFRTT